MRNKERINEFCDRLKVVWGRVPDQRFGQFMMNALGAMQASGRDPFFPEEKEMIEFLDRYTLENSPYIKRSK